jgi:hypothetical protein
VLPSLPLACQASALLLSYAPEMERVNGIAPLSRPWHGRILLLNHTRKNGVPSRSLTSNLEFRTLPLCVLSYGDKESNPWPVSFTGQMHLATRSLELLCVQGFEWYARPVTLRNPALI